MLLLAPWGGKQSSTEKSFLSSKQSFPKSLPTNSTWPAETCNCIQDLKPCLFQRVFKGKEQNTNIILMYAIQGGPPLENKDGETCQSLNFLSLSQTDMINIRFLHEQYYNSI